MSSSPIGGGFRPAINGTTASNVHGSAAAGPTKTDSKIRQFASTNFRQINSSFDRFKRSSPMKAVLKVFNHGQKKSDGYSSLTLKPRADTADGYANFPVQPNDDTNGYRPVPSSALRQNAIDTNGYGPVPSSALRENAKGKIGYDSVPPSALRENATGKIGYDTVPPRVVEGNTVDTNGYEQLPESAFKTGGDQHRTGDPGEMEPGVGMIGTGYDDIPEFKKDPNS